MLLVYPLLVLQKELDMCFTKHIQSVINLLYDEHLNKLGLQRLESKHLYLDILCLDKLTFNCFYLTFSDFDIRVSNLHNNHIISLPSCNILFLHCIYGLPKEFFRY